MNNNENSNKKRIQFIDLAKGVCIMLVVLYHCQIDLPGFTYVRMPLYFLISGIFFKSYGGFMNFTLKKVNKNLIPFVFYYLVGFAISMALLKLFPGHQFSALEGDQTFSLFDPVFSKPFFNFFIWFLLALFNANILFFLVQKFVPQKFVQLVVVFLLAGLGGWLTEEGITLPMYLQKTFEFLPFFYLGFLLKRTEILYANKYDRYNLIFASVLLGIFYVCVAYDLGQYFFMKYLMSSMGVIAVLFFCKTISSLPLVSYYGRYSIVILCTHGLILPALRFLMLPHLAGMNSIVVSLVLFGVIMLLEIPAIYFCINYLGHFTAQKDIIKVAA